MYQCKYIKGHRLKTILSAANCIIPAHHHLESAGTMNTIGVMDHAIAQMPAELRFQFLLFISIVHVLGIFFGGRCFSNNRQADQIRQLQWMERSMIRGFRMGFLGLKSYICMGYFTRESTWNGIHYCGPIKYDQTPPDPLIRELCQDKRKVCV
jgi:hypothetical protein